MTPEKMAQDAIKRLNDWIARSAGQHKRYQKAKKRPNEGAKSNLATASG